MNNITKAEACIIIIMSPSSAKKKKKKKQKVSILILIKKRKINEVFKKEKKTLITARCVLEKNEWDIIHANIY